MLSTWRYGDSGIYGETIMMSPADFIWAITSEIRLTIDGMRIINWQILDSEHLGRGRGG